MLSQSVTPDNIHVFSEVSPQDFIDLNVLKVITSNCIE